MCQFHLTGALLVAATALAAGPSQAASMDCLHFDAFEGGLAPAGPMREGQRLHNCARRTAQPRPSPRLRDLKWNPTVAASAQSWANQCNWAHPGGHPYGENLAAGSIGYDAPGLVPMWIDEYVHYNYAGNTCAAGQICGHYTQVVWRTTQELGCATNTCSGALPWGGTGQWFYLVCRYSPPGNNGGRPY